MNEQQITIDGRSWPLEEPFLVIAIESGGASRHLSTPRVSARSLSDAHSDRLSGCQAEREILRSTEPHRADFVKAVVSGEELIRLQNLVTRVIVDASIIDYMLALVERTRNHESLALGVSPRGSQALYRAAQALAMVEGREYVIPDDVKRLVVPVFAHRVVVSSRVALANRSSEWAERVLQEILTMVDVPL